MIVLKQMRDIETKPRIERMHGKENHAPKPLNTNKCEQCGITCEDVWQEYLTECKKWNRPITKTRKDFDDFVDNGGGVCTEEASCDWGPTCEGCYEHQDYYE